MTARCTVSVGMISFMGCCLLPIFILDRPIQLLNVLHKKSAVALNWAAPSRAPVRRQRKRLHRKPSQAQQDANLVHVSSGRTRRVAPSVSTSEGQQERLFVFTRHKPDDVRLLAFGCRNASTSILRNDIQHKEGATRHGGVSTNTWLPFSQ
ncbi:unnamed protein product [Ectocarpus sp. 4 AP-2014]